MYNKYMFAYLVINESDNQGEQILGTQQAISYYDALARLDDNIEENYPEKEGWVVVNKIMNKEPIEFVSELA